MINFIKDIDLIDHVSEYDKILVGTNIYCMMTQGFQRKIMLNYPYVMDRNLETKYGDASKMGSILECQNDGEPTFTLMFICKGNFRPDLSSDFLSYESLEKCLKIADKLYSGMKIATTLLGSSRFDGNGDREKILDIFNKSVKKMNLTIYDYEQKSRDEELLGILKDEMKVKKEDYQKFVEMVKERKRKAEIRKKKNGHAGY